MMMTRPGSVARTVALCAMGVNSQRSSKYSPGVYGFDSRTMPRSSTVLANNRPERTM